MNPQVKEISKEDPKIVCMYCNKSEINSLEWGPMYNLAGVTVHYFCMLFSAGLSQNGEDEEGILGFLPIDIRKELKRGDKLKCKFCKQARATIGCSVKNCKTSYHYPCGLEKKCVFHFIGNFESYCAQHKEPVHIPLSKSEWECPICWAPVHDEDIPLWPPCCQKRVFHKRCIMEMAKNHGAHFFKCPLCNDREIFSVAMRRSGVYLPDRDASWETDPNAFAEHTELYSICDASTCQCPKGRKHNSKSESKPWKIIRCGACGASAIHRRCGNLKNLTWRCQTCSDVLSEKRRNESINSSRIQRHQYDLSDSEEIEEEIIGVKEAITEAPEVESSATADSSSEDDAKRVPVYDERYRRVLLMEDSSGSGTDDSEGEESGDNKDDSSDLFIQANSRLRQRLERKTLVSKATSLRSTKKSNISGLFKTVLKDMNRIEGMKQEGSDFISRRQNFVDSANKLHDNYNDKQWQYIRSSTFDTKLKNAIVQCCRQNSSTSTSGSSEGQLATGNVSDPVHTDSPGNIIPVSLPLVGRDKLIKVDSRKKIEGHVLLKPKPEVISESPSRSVKISLKGVTHHCNNTAALPNFTIESTAEVHACEEAETKTKSQCSPSNDLTDDIIVVSNQTAKVVEPEDTCITLEDSEDSDVEILSANVQPKPYRKTTAFLEMVKRARGGKPAPSAPVVRLGVDDDQNDDIEFINTVDHPKPTITFSSFRQPAIAIPSISAAFLRVINSSNEHPSTRSQFSGRLSNAVRNNLKSGSNRDVEMIELISDDEETPGSTHGADKGESKSTKCSKKRDRLNSTDVAVVQGSSSSASHSKRQRT